jgi:hypothetical protein
MIYPVMLKLDLGRGSALATRVTISFAAPPD